MPLARDYAPDELVQALRERGPKLLIAYYRPDPDLHALIHEAVEGNAFRAFQKLSPKPSDTFRIWAKARLSFSAMFDFASSIKGGEDPPKGVVRGDAAGQIKESVEPRPLGLAILFHRHPLIGTTDDRAQRDREESEELVLLGPLHAGIGQGGKVFRDCRTG